MANLLDYIGWRGDLSLKASPFNEVDALILAELSFLDFTAIVPPPELGRGVVLREAAAEFFRRSEGKEVDMGVLVPDAIPDMFCRMAGSIRYGDMVLGGFESLTDLALEQQFAALTVELGDGSVCVAFRGTDDTLVGWKEDLNLSFLEKIPSQEQARAYLARIAQQYKKEKLRITGHSKGGNLAVFSAVNADEKTQKRILGVYNNDGPGFLSDLREREEYLRIADRITTIVPQSSVVGRLLEHDRNMQVVYSTASGVMQHDGFSWEVLGTEFVRLKDFSREGKLLDETIDRWAESLSPQQREAFADAVYEVLTATGARTLSDLRGEKLSSAAAIVKTFSNLDRDTRRALTSALRALVEEGARSIAQDVSENELEKLKRRLQEEKNRRFEKKK